MDHVSSLESVPELRWAPMPHLVLPSPHHAYCLTPFLPTDEQVLGKILNDPAVAPTSGLGRMDPTRLHEWLDIRRTPGYLLLDLPVIRQVDRLQDTVPEAIGVFHLFRESFRALYGSADSPDKRARVKANLALPRYQAQWQMGCFIDPQKGGKGVMQAAGEAYLKNCRYIHERPGLVSGGWLQGNGPSRRLQHRLGFKPMGKLPNVLNGLAAMPSIWMGGGEIDKCKTIYASLMDVSDEDLAADMLADIQWEERKKRNACEGCDYGNIDSMPSRPPHHARGRSEGVV